MQQKQLTALPIRRLADYGTAAQLECKLKAARFKLARDKWLAYLKERGNGST